ncbi:hypothetical protein K438DRAFT_1764650 [Mycena galopus ATCC 62051]|nr:hypothetical protein K438DRAFT_1764650 [Mycena galopus ATCC 62051]
MPLFALSLALLLLLGAFTRFGGLASDAPPGAEPKAYAIGRQCTRSGPYGTANSVVANAEHRSSVVIPYRAGTYMVFELAGLEHAPVRDFGKRETKKHTLPVVDLEALHAFVCCYIPEVVITARPSTMSLETANRRTDAECGRVNNRKYVGNSRRFKSPENSPPRGTVVYEHEHLQCAETDRPNKHGPEGRSVAVHSFLLPTSMASNVLALPSTKTTRFTIRRHARTSAVVPKASSNPTRLFR